MSRNIALPLSITAVMLSGCVTAPRMSAHTPFTLNETSARFEERIRARFPIGSSEVALTRELRSEHFKIGSFDVPAQSNPEGFTSQAIYNGSYYVACEIDWHVWWRADGGRIAVISASYGDTCL